jgi:hypothetical protein
LAHKLKTLNVLLVLAWNLDIGELLELLPLVVSFLPDVVLVS